MPESHPAKLLRVHISESDRFEGKPLYEAIVAKCRELNIAGATVFRGLEGYGDSAQMHKTHLARRDQPIVITIVDSAENLNRLAAELERMLDTGVLAVSDVEVIRVQKKAAVDRENQLSSEA